MKKHIIAITAAAIALFTVITATAQTNLTNIKTRAIAFEQGVSGASNITLAVYPSYAPDLINKDGKKDQWGFGIAATYTFSGDIGQHLFTGLRLDYLGSEIWVPSINGGLKADVQIFGKNFTPFVYTGVIKPLKTDANVPTDWGMIAGAGVRTDLWRGKLFGMDATLGIGVAAEKWSRFDGTVYHGFVPLTIKW